jgi:hypothetical protein
MNGTDSASTLTSQGAYSSNQTTAYRSLDCTPDLMVIQCIHALTVCCSELLSGG